MNIKKKRMTIITCIVTGTCILAGSAFANYSTSNGYGVYKDALKKLIGTDNYTMGMNVKISAGGQDFDAVSVVEKYDADGEVTSSRTESSTNFDGTVSEYKTVTKNNINYNFNSHDESGNWSSYKSYGNSAMFAVADEDKETVDKVTKFVELLTDTVVGDLKNNFVYISDTENGGAKYSIALDSIQIPELINAGISALCSVNRTSGSEEYMNDISYTNPDYYFYNDTSVKSVKCDFEVDSQGRLVNNNIVVEFESLGTDSEKHSLVVNMNLNMSDYGTTVPDDLPSDAKVLSIDDYYEAQDTVEVAQ